MTESSDNKKPRELEGREPARSMPDTFIFAIVASVLGLGYMVAVFLFGLFGLMLAIPSFGILLAGIISALVGLAQKRNRYTPYLWRYVGVLAVLVGMVAFLSPGLGTLRLLNLHCYTRVAMTGGQNELQSWAVDLLAQPRDPMHQDGSGWRIPREQCSKQVWRLKPKRISIEQLFQNDQEGVRLMYGGGFLHWYIVLGPPGSLPDPKFEENLTENDWFRWSDGVYCWFPD